MAQPVSVHQVKILSIMYVLAAMLLCVKAVVNLTSAHLATKDTLLLIISVSVLKTKLPALFLANAYNVIYQTVHVATILIFALKWILEFLSINK
jgi:hypothetical protein